MQICRVWNVSLKTGQKIQVATIEQEGRKPTMCRGCEAPCCRNLLPILTQEEFLGRKFDMQYSEPPSWLKEQSPRAQYVATVIKNPNTGHCSYFDPEKNECSAWPFIPQSCLAYDCRDETRAKIAKVKAA